MRVKNVGNTKHGLRYHPLYRIWSGIKDRCYYTKSDSYKWYGAKGIVMCDEWLHSPEVFIEWAISNGWQKGLQIDRINSDGSYSPDNCRIVPASKNHQNKSSNVFFTYNNQEKCISEWAKDLGMNIFTLRNRLKRHDVAAAFNTPVKHKKNVNRL